MDKAKEKNMNWRKKKRYIPLMIVEQHGSGSSKKSMLKFIYVNVVNNGVTVHTGQMIK